jgi:hypothetical protein
LFVGFESFVCQSHSFIPSSPWHHSETLSL